MQFESQWPGDAIAAPSCPTDDREDAGFERRPQCAAVNWGIRHDEPVRWLSDPNPWGRRVAALTPSVINLAIEGLALSAATLHPEFFPLGKPDHRGDPGTDRPNGREADTAPTNFAVWLAWISSIVSMVAGLWSKMRRGREIRRITAAWETIDDRTLKDIGICRYEIEYGRNARHWS
jgi:uncharacterized protein YjiS (DUF1127 family)